MSRSNIPYSDEDLQEGEEELEAFYRSKGTSGQTRRAQEHAQRVQRVVTALVILAIALILFGYLMMQHLYFYAVGVLFIFGVVLVVVNEILKQKRE
jgi:hypothetical protein